MLVYSTILFLTVFSISCFGRVIPEGGLSREEVRNLQLAFSYLKRYGYMYVNSGKTDGTVDDSTALQRFQEFMGLPATDRYDEATMSVINHPRCGLVDPVDSYEHMHQSVSLLGGRWNKTELTYKIRGSASGLSKKQVAATVREAFDLFTPHVPLTFTSVAKGDPSDIEIHFRSQNKDPQMDGAGKSVGRAYPPLAGTVNLGKIFLDADEDYTIGEARGIPLLPVVAHEIGHVLGLGHTPNSNSIMTPCVPSYSPNFELSQEDIETLSLLYGGSSRSAAHPVASAGNHALCDMTSYDAVTVMDDFLYVFKGDKYWQLSTTTASLLTSAEGDLIMSVWPEIEGDVNIIYKNSLDHVVVTKGGKYYEYDATGILFPWAPLSLRDLGLPKNAEAGYSIQENGYIIRSGKLWLMNEVSRTVHPDSPKSIRRLWGVDSINNMDSAFILGDYLYIVNGQDYVRLDVNTAQLDGSGTRNFAEDFLGC